MMSGQRSVENNFKKLPKHEIMHKLWLVMWIDNGNFWFTCIQIGKMIGRLTNYSIHDFENICGHIRCSTSSFWEGYFEFFNCRTKRNRIRDISLAWQLNQTRFWCSKKNQEQTVIDLRWLVNFLPVVQQYPWPPCGKSQICGFSLLLIRTTAGHWMLGTHWMPGLQGSHFLKKFGLTNQKRWNKIWNGPDIGRRKVSRICFSLT